MATSGGVSMNELRQAVRGAGTGRISHVMAVVLETDGTLSVISRSQAADLSALGDLGCRSSPAT